MNNPGKYPPRKMRYDTVSRLNGRTNSKQN
jgi:hypothetical protein